MLLSEDFLIVLSLTLLPIVPLTTVFATLGPGRRVPQPVFYAINAIASGQTSARFNSSLGNGSGVQGREGCEKALHSGSLHSSWEKIWLLLSWLMS